MTMFNERPNFFFSLLPVLLLGEVGAKKIRGELCINKVGLALNHRCNGGSVSQNFELWPLFTIWRFPGFKGRPAFRIGLYEVLTLDIFQVLCLSLLLPKQFQVSKKRMKKTELQMMLKKVEDKNCQKAKFALIHPSTLHVPFVQQKVGSLLDHLDHQCYCCYYLCFCCCCYHLVFQLSEFLIA